MLKEWFEEKIKSDIEVELEEIIRNFDLQCHSDLYNAIKHGFRAKYTHLYIEMSISNKFKSTLYDGLGFCMWLCPKDEGKKDKYIFKRVVKAVTARNLENYFSNLCSIYGYLFLSQSFSRSFNKVYSIPTFTESLILESANFEKEIKITSCVHSEFVKTLEDLFNSTGMSFYFSKNDRVYYIYGNSKISIHKLDFILDPSRKEIIDEISALTASLDEVKRMLKKATNKSNKAKRNLERFSQKRNKQAVANQESIIKTSEKEIKKLRKERDKNNLALKDKKLLKVYLDSKVSKEVPIIGGEIGTITLFPINSKWSYSPELITLLIKTTITNHIIRIFTADNEEYDFSPTKDGLCPFCNQILLVKICNHVFFLEGETEPELLIENKVEEHLSNYMPNYLNSLDEIFDLFKDYNQIEATVPSNLVAKTAIELEAKPFYHEFWATSDYERLIALVLGAHIKS